MAAYVAGWNMPGYLPDHEVTLYPTWEGARDALVWELERCDLPYAGETDHVADTDAAEAECNAAIALLNAAPVGEDITTAPVMGYVFFVSFDADQTAEEIII